MSRIASSGDIRQRQPRVRDPEHMGRIARLPCLACWIRRGVLVRGVHVAHVRSGYPEAEGWREVGKAEKPSDFRTLPLCPRCHLDGPDAQHRSNEKEWYERLGIYPPDLCAALVVAFSSGQSGENVLHRFVAAARKACADRAYRA